MTRINLFLAKPFRRSPATLDSLAWGKTNFETTSSTLVFAALLIVCSVAVGCSSDKPKSESSSQPAVTQPTLPAVSTPTTAPAAPALQAATKPVHKKIVHKAPVTLAYADKTSGVSFQYPRKDALKSGDAAGEFVSSDPTPMDFVQPGGVAVAAVTVPESTYPDSDLVSAFFNVSLNKTLTEEQCGEFATPQATPASPADPATPASANVQPSTSGPVAVQPGKLMIGDMELQSSETVASQGTREEASKYYHVFENGGCYEFALKVATTGGETDGVKHVDRKEVFARLEKILATVKINPVSAPDVTASAPATATPTTAPASPAQ
jgi:hypothetical protein